MANFQSPKSRNWNIDWNSHQLNSNRWYMMRPLSQTQHSRSQGGRNASIQVCYGTPFIS